MIRRYLVLLKMVQKVPVPSTGKMNTRPAVLYWPVMRSSGMNSFILNVLALVSALYDKKKQVNDCDSLKRIPKKCWKILAYATFCVWNLDNPLTWIWEKVDLIVTASSPWFSTMESINIGSRTGTLISGMPLWNVAMVRIAKEIHWI